MTGQPPSGDSPTPLHRPGSVIPLRGAANPLSPTVIAVTSGKGGVGKSNVAVNLAVAIASSGGRVLAVDADLGLANMDLLLGVAPTHTVADVLCGDASIDEVLVPGPKNVWLLPGASGRTDLSGLTDVQLRSLFTAIDTLDHRFDVVVVDTGSGVGSSAVGFASAARDIVMVVTPEPTAVADACGMLRVLSGDYGVRRVKVLTNLVRSDEEGEQVFARLANLDARSIDVGLDHLGSIPRDPAMGRAVMRGEPVMLAYPESPAARALSKVARRLAASDERDDRQGAMRLFWRRLLRQETM